MTTSDSLVSDRYRLHERLGSGGMGVVWRATDELLNRQVAIKRIRLDGRNDETVQLSRQRTLREARIAAQLHHPHVVSIFDVLTVDGEPWLVLEHLPCDTLSTAIKTHGAPTPRIVAGLGVAVADALAAAHEVGIVHRDVKPANVLLGKTGTVKLTDFGIAHAIGDINLTGTGLITGTPAYLAPEVATGGESGAPSDVYSLGATLYAAVEGVPPFRAEDNNVFRMLQLVAAGQFPPPKQAGPLTPVLSRLMDLDPLARPSAAQARDLLRAVLDERPASSSTPAPPRPTSRPFALGRPSGPIPGLPDETAYRQSAGGVHIALVTAMVLMALIAIVLIIAL